MGVHFFEMAQFLLREASSKLRTSGKGLPEHRYRVHTTKIRARCINALLRRRRHQQDFQVAGRATQRRKKKRAIRDPGTGAHSYTHTRTHPRPVDAFTPQHTHQRRFALNRKHETQQLAGENGRGNETQKKWASSHALFERKRTRAGGPFS